jgi:hypothetical protein
MPERALLRLRRAGIPVYDVQKTRADILCLRVAKRDVDKVFALYPSNGAALNAYTPYVVKRGKQKGLTRLAEIVKDRVGLCLGVLLFFGWIAFADSFVFAVEFVGTDVYAREVYEAVEEAGIRTFAPYHKGKEDVVCARLLTIDGVEYCSVQKKGFRLRVEIRETSFVKENRRTGNMLAEREGVLESITVLRGSLLKTKGEQVRVGDVLAADYHTAEDGSRTPVELIARARISCVYEREIAAESAESAFAIAYLNERLEADCTVTESSVTPIADGVFQVKISYLATQSFNF